MRTSLEEIAPRFRDTAHAIGMAVAATVDAAGRPRTRVVQPVWEWSGGELTGWMTTVATAPKVADVQRLPVLSLTYWNPAQDTATADCAVEVLGDAAERAAAWARVATAPGAARFDPSSHWSGPDDPTFGVLRLRPTALQVMEGTLMTAGEGDLLRWRVRPTS